MAFQRWQGLGSVLALSQPQLHQKLRTLFLYHQHRALVRCAHQHLSNIHCPIGGMLVHAFTQLSCRNVPLLMNFPGQGELPRDLTAPVGTGTERQPRAHGTARGHRSFPRDRIPASRARPLPGKEGQQGGMPFAARGLPGEGGLAGAAPAGRAAAAAGPGVPVSRCPSVPVSPAADPACPLAVPHRPPPPLQPPGILRRAAMHGTRPSAPPSRLSPLLPHTQLKSRSSGLRWQPSWSHGFFWVGRDF